MAEKHLQINPAGQIEEREFVVETTGAPDAGRGVATGPDGKLHPSVLPTGVGADVVVRVASENLAAGDLVNIWNDADTPKVRKAVATEYAKRANGFVLAAVTATQNATVYKEGTNTQLAGLTPGAEYFLSAETPGAVTLTAPTTAGHIVQALGTAVSATELDFEPSRAIIRA